MDKGGLQEQLRELKQYYLNDQFMAETVAQLHKDLQSSGLALQKDLSADPDLILNALEEMVRTLLEGNTERLFALLYRIDLSEKEVSAFLHPDHEEDPASAIAQAIMDRELKKVIIRNYLAKRGP